MFGFATDKYAIIPHGVKNSTKEIIQSTLETVIVETSIAKTVLVGAMINGNSNTLLVPANISQNEYDNLKVLTEAEINIVEINSKYTALGNLILTNDKGAIISNLFEKETRTQIEEALNVETIVGTILGSPLVGTIGLTTNRGCLVHPMLSQEEIAEIESILHTRVDLCTVNRGIPYPKVGVIANSMGALIGEDTTGPESMRIFDVLLSPL